MFLPFLLLSCTNFLNEQNLKKEIEKQINYAKAEEVSISVTPEFSKYGTTYPNVTKTYKVSDIFTVKFKEESDYQFIRWAVKDLSFENDISGIVRIDDPEQLETEVEVIGSGKDVIICPEVLQRPRVKDFYPELKIDGVPRDSSIVLVFDKAISEDNDLSKIKVLSAGDSVDDTYTNRVLNENTITLTADLNNLIDVDSGKVKNVSVVIPGDFYYIENDEKVIQGNEISYTFKINNTTTNKAEITVSTPKVKGTVIPEGTKEYNIGDSFTVKFEPENGYNFTCWSILNCEDSDLLVEEDLYSKSVKITVLSACKGVSITPLSEQIPAIEKSVSPEFSTYGVPVSSKIIMNFTKPVLCNAVTFDNIHITDELGRSLNEYFEAPELDFADPLNETCNGFVITPKYSKVMDLMDFLFESKNIHDITITVDPVIEDKSGLKMPESFSYTYRVYYYIEKDQPIINSFEIAKTPEDLENKNYLVSTDYKTWSEADYHKNHVKSVWIKCDATDITSGVTGLLVRETLLEDNDGNPLNSSQENIIPYTVGSITEYSFTSNNDGLCSLEIFVVDSYGNVSVNSYKYYLIKDTKFSNYMIKAYSSVERFVFDNNPKTIDSVDKSALEIFYYSENASDDEWYGNRKTIKEDFSFQFLWGSEKENYEYSSTEIGMDLDFTIPGKNVKANYGFVIPEETIDKTKNTYYKLKVMDEALNEIQFTGCIYAKPKIETAVVTKLDKTKGSIAVKVTSADVLPNENIYYFIYGEAVNKITLEHSEVQYFGMICNFSSFSSNLNGEISGSDSCEINTEDYNYVLYAAKVCKKSDDFLGYIPIPTYAHEAGYISAPVCVDSYFMGTDETLIPDFKFDYSSAGLGTGSYNLNISMGENQYKKYDFIEVYYVIAPTGTEKKFALGRLNNNNDSFLLKQTELFAQERYDVTGGYYYSNFKYSSPITKIGIRAIIGEEEYVKELPNLSPKDFAVDNIPPYVSLNSVFSVSQRCLYFVGKYLLDIHSGLEKIDGKYQVHYYILPCEDKWKTDILISAVGAIEPEEIYSTSVMDGFFEFDDESEKDSYDRWIIKIDLPEVLPDNKYIICFECKDTVGNKFCGPVSFYEKKFMANKATHEISDVTKKYCLMYDIVTPDISYNTKYGCLIQVEKFNKSTSEWELSSPFFSNPNFTNDFGKIRFDIVNNDDGSFYRASVMESVISVGPNGQNVSSFAMYGCKITDTIYYSDKNVPQGGYVVLDMSDNFVPICEQPCLMSTVYSKIKYGEDVDLWERNTTDAQHLNTRVVSNMEKYKPSDEVPVGCYYCVIVHYADGSSDISKIYKK